jgi:hypothetical protein
MRHEMESATSLARLVPMHEHMAQAAEGDHWHTALTEAGLEPARVPDVVTSPAWPALAAGLRHAEAHGLEPTRRLAACIGRADFTGAHDTAAVLHARLDTQVRAALRNAPVREEGTIAGLITPARRNDDPVMASTLVDIQNLIAQRAETLGQQAIDQKEPWLPDFGATPRHAQARPAWKRAVDTVAAYRERHAITTRHALARNRRATTIGTPVTTRGPPAPSTTPERSRMCGVVPPRQRR